MSDTMTGAAEECSIMSCAKSRKRFSGGWLLWTHCRHWLWLTDIRVNDWAGHSWKIYCRHFLSKCYCSIVGLLTASVCFSVSVSFSYFLLLARYVPNVAKRSIWDQCKNVYWRPPDRPATDPSFRKFQMAISPQRIIRSTSCLVLRWGFRRRRI